MKDKPTKKMSPELEEMIDASLTSCECTIKNYTKSFHPTEAMQSTEEVLKRFRSFYDISDQNKKFDELKNMYENKYGVKYD